jgi:predicted DNA-binding transcriptional regulator
MALKGNLRDFNISQLFNLINLARKTGTLIVESSNEKVMVSFREGKLAYACLSQEDNSLAAILYHAKKLSASQFRALKERSENLNDKELGLLLVNANYIDQQSILASLQSHFLNVVNRLFTWVEGFFRFENDLLPPEDKITVRLSLENIIIEGARRMKEQEQLKEEIPDLEMALKFADRPGANIRNFSLSMNEWRVVSYINPKNTMRKIARAVRMSDLEIRRIVYGLLQAGLVEVVQPEGIPFPPMPVPVHPVISQPNTEEQKSLINRIIKRIRSL